MKLIITKASVGSKMVWVAVDVYTRISSSEHISSAQPFPTTTSHLAAHRSLSRVARLRQKAQIVYALQTIAVLSISCSNCLPFQWIWWHALQLLIKITFFSASPKIPPNQFNYLPIPRLAHHLQIARLSLLISFRLRFVNRRNFTYLGRFCLWAPYRGDRWVSNRLWDGLAINVVEWKWVIIGVNIVHVY